jgi:hypothetical protein
MMGDINRHCGRPPSRSAAIARVAAFAIVFAAATASAQDAPVPAVGPASPPRELCATGKGLMPSSPSLDRTKAAWVKGDPLVIVAIGSGSTAGTSPNGEEAAYPHYLEEALHQRYPERDIRIINQGHAGEAAGAMTARFQTEVLPEKPTLVIWQTGTVDAVRSLNVDNFSATLNAGIAALISGGADVILVNPQYAARIELLINYDPYLQAFDVANSQTDATLFDRFRIMRNWVAKGTIDLSTGSKELRRKKAEEAQACIGVLLADIVTKALK